MKASHKELWIPVKTGRGFTQVQILPGQFIFGRHEAAKELKMRPGSVRNRMEKLKNIGNLDIKPDKHFSLISIINWDSYQLSINEVGQPTGQPTDNQRTTNGHIQELKNVKNDKKKEIDVIFFYWKERMNHPNAKLDSKRKSKIEARLKEGRSIEEFKKAIDGCKGSKWHMGENDKNKVFDDIELICRDAVKFEGFLNPIPKPDDQYSHFEIVGAKNEPVKVKCNFCGEPYFVKENHQCKNQDKED